MKNKHLQNVLKQQQHYTENIMYRKCSITSITLQRLIVEFYYFRNLASAASRAQRAEKPPWSTKHRHFRTGYASGKRWLAGERSLRREFSSDGDDSADGAANYATDPHASRAAPSAEADGKLGQPHWNALDDVRKCFEIQRHWCWVDCAILTRQEASSILLRYFT